MEYHKRRSYIALLVKLSKKDRQIFALLHEAFNDKQDDTLRNHVVKRIQTIGITQYSKNLVLSGHPDRLHLLPH